MARLLLLLLACLICSQLEELFCCADLAPASAGNDGGLEVPLPSPTSTSPAAPASVSHPPFSATAPPMSPRHSSEDVKSIPSEAPSGSRRLGKHDHAAAGGEIVVGGLATVTFAAVFAYIRVTRRKGDRSPQNDT